MNQSFSSIIPKNSIFGPPARSHTLGTNPFQHLVSLIKLETLKILPFSVKSLTVAKCRHGEDKGYGITVMKDPLLAINVNKIAVCIKWKKEDEEECMMIEEILKEARKAHQNRVLGSQSMLWEKLLSTYYQIEGVVKQRPIFILIDSESTYNFLDIEVANQTWCTSQHRKVSQLSVDYARVQIHWCSQSPIWEGVMLFCGLSGLRNTAMLSLDLIS